MIPHRFDRVVRDAIVFSLACALLVSVLGALWLHATHVTGDPPVVHFVAWTLLGGAATALSCVAMSSTFRVTSGDRLVSLGLPNALTLARFVLIAPTVLLLSAMRYPEALLCYIVLFATDVVDGVVARRRRIASEFGVMADPLADVASTFAVFTVFFLQGQCPPWLYLLLIARYAMLLVGSLALFLAIGPFTLKATLPGKVVGVVQATAASIIIAGVMAGGLSEGTKRVLFAFLGIGFASIVASQAFIGWQLVRRRASRIGPTR